MGLRKKTFLYSVVLAVIMIAFIIGYFVLMLPSLYVDYVMNSNLESVVEILAQILNMRINDSVIAHIIFVINSQNQLLDGGQALELLAKKRFDMAVLDIMVPKVNGLDVLQYIKEHQSSRNKMFMSLILLLSCTLHGLL